MTHAGSALVALLALVLPVVTTGCVGVASAPAQTSRVNLSVHFAAVWWSQDQMEGLDPDNPPEKRTEIELIRWDSSDPIGEPNPASFDVIATLANSAIPHGLYVEMEQRWGIGPLRGEVPTNWTQWRTITRTGPVFVDAATPQVLRLATVDLATQQSRLFAQDLWPWVYESRVSVAEGEGAPSLFEAVVHQLPILAAD